MACKLGTLQVGLGASGYVNQAVIKREGSCKQRGSDLEKGCLWMEWDPQEVAGL